MNKNYYVDNEGLLAELVKRRAVVADCEQNDKELPKISDYIGKCIYDICNNLSHSPNFIGYSYRLEMVGDAIENCLRVVDNYDPATATRIGKPNPFGYFTQIAYYAFLRRIATEKKQSYIKGKLIEQLPMDELIEFDFDTGETSNFMENIRENYYFDTAQYEEKNKIKKKTKKQKLEEFMGSEEEQ